MAFDGFGGTGGQLAQQLEAARSAGTGYHPMEASSSLSVSTILSFVLSLVQTTSAIIGKYRY